MTQSRFHEDDLEPESKNTIDQKIKSLVTILLLEKNLEYNNSAVLGGLEDFFNRFIKETNPELLRHLDKLKIEFPQYTQLTHSQRAKWIHNTLSLLNVIQSTNTEEVLKESENPEEEHESPSPGQLRRSYKRKNSKAKVSSTSHQDSAPVSTKIPSSLDDDLEISTRWRNILKKMEILTYRDAINSFPRSHIQVVNIASLRAGELHAIVGKITKIIAPQYSRGRSKGYVQATIRDNSSTLTAVWFGRSWVARSLKKDQLIMLTGRYSNFRGSSRFNVETQEIMKPPYQTKLNSIIPIYPLSEGISQATMRKIIQSAVKRSLPLITDYLPDRIRIAQNLPSLQESISIIHSPKNLTEEKKAKTRLAFDEMLLLQLGLLKKKANEQGTLSQSIQIDKSVQDKFTNSLPYSLTSDQIKATSTILDDMSAPSPMMRLLQGDVGSGKTVVAASALLAAVSKNFQAALMAPTELLAEQHFKTLTSIFSQGDRDVNDNGGPYRGFSGLLNGRPINIALLTGSMSSGTKSSIQKLIKNGSVDIAIGTHSLIQKDVEFENLGLAIVDEQHRFGVAQRASLRNKGFAPHLLVMTATPIPRTMALSLYGDLDITTIREMPPGRPRIRTKTLTPDERGRAYTFIEKEVTQGRQAFVICPLVEESESIQAKSAIQEHKKLDTQVFPNLRVGLLHGRMRPLEKEKIMTDFRERKLDILVSTAVVEVGIDIPNATVMMVEGAERFGLSQLHQYRGRVGRGVSESYCILISDSEAPEARERLNIMEKTIDGFELSEADLQMRGPGEFFGTKQSGLPDLNIAWLTNLSLLESVRECAVEILDQDPNMVDSSNKKLKAELSRFWKRAESIQEGG